MYNFTHVKHFFEKKTLYIWKIYHYFSKCQPLWVIHFNLSFFFFIPYEMDLRRTKFLCGTLSLLSCHPCVNGSAPVTLDTMVVKGFDKLE